MRCYLMKGGHIVAVEMLTLGSDDELVAQGRAHFERLAQEKRLDGFEVWDKARKVYASPGEQADAIIDRRVEE